MLRINFLVVAALLSTSALAPGQHGIARNSRSQPGLEPSKGLSQQRLAGYLKTKSHVVENCKTKDACILKTILKNGNWRRTVGVEICVAQKRCRLLCPLGDARHFSMPSF